MGNDGWQSGEWLPHTAIMSMNLSLDSLAQADPLLRVEEAKAGVRALAGTDVSLSYPGIDQSGTLIRFS